jgi:hypothetical protein
MITTAVRSISTSLGVHTYSNRPGGYLPPGLFFRCVATNPRIVRALIRELRTRIGHWFNLATLLPSHSGVFSTYQG